MTTLTPPQGGSAGLDTALSAKIVIAGGFGLGKTTFVGAISEIPPLRTEESMTSAAAAVDDASKVASRSAGSWPSGTPSR